MAITPSFAACSKPVPTSKQPTHKGKEQCRNHMSELEDQRDRVVLTSEAEAEAEADNKDGVI